MLRLACSALVASALVLTPLTIPIQSADQAQAEAAGGGKGAAGKKKKRELTKGQKANRERDKECRRQFSEGKKAGKIEKGVSQAKFVSECNAKLKAKSG